MNSKCNYLASLTTSKTLWPTEAGIKKKMIRSQ